MSHDFVFAGDPCPQCCRPLRIVGGCQAWMGPRLVRVDFYRCEKGHEYHARVTRPGALVQTLGLYEGKGVKSEVIRVEHFA